MVGGTIPTAIDDALVLFFTVTVCSATVLMNSRIVREYIRNKSFRTPSNFYVFIRSIIYMINSMCWLTAIYGSVAFNTDIQFAFQLAAFCNWSHAGSELLFSLNRCIGIGFWRYYDDVYTKKLTFLSCLVPYIFSLFGRFYFWGYLSCEMAFVKETYLSYYIKNKDLCFERYEYIIFCYFIPCSGTALLINVITFVLLMKFLRAKRAGIITERSKIILNIGQYVLSVFQTTVTTFAFIMWTIEGKGSSLNPLYHFLLISSIPFTRDLVEGLCVFIVYRKYTFPKSWGSYFRRQRFQQTATTQG